MDTDAVPGHETQVGALTQNDVEALLVKQVIHWLPPSLQATSSIDRPLKCYCAVELPRRISASCRCIDSNSRLSNSTSGTSAISRFSPSPRLRKRRRETRRRGPKEYVFIYRKYPVITCFLQGKRSEPGSKSNMKDVYNNEGFLADINVQVIKPVVFTANGEDACKMLIIVDLLVK